MKIQVEIDLTPEELRRFVGLPDMQPFWDGLYKRMSEGDSEMIQQMAKTAFTEGMKTVDLSARILKSLGAYASSRLSEGKDAEDETKAPTRKPTAKKAAPKSSS